MDFFSDAIGSYALINTQKCSIENIGDNIKHRCIAVYEVIRIINGLPLFALAHYERLIHSSLKAGIGLNVSYIQFIKQIKELLDLNSLKIGNIKIVNFKNSELGEHYFILFPIKFLYPSDYDYQNGIKVLTYEIERQQPNVKIFNNQYKKIISALLNADKSVYEVLLINEKHYITEGSKSNVFFIVDNTLVTPPVHMVLPGITRMKILELCRMHHLTYAEREFHITELPTAAAAFISGTSPKILPIHRVDDNIIFQNIHHPVVQQLQFLFDAAIKADLDRFEFDLE